MMNKAAATLGIILAFGRTTGNSQVQRQDHNQTVQQNNGTVTQNNIVINQLKAATIQAAIKVASWDRVLLPANEPDPQTKCASLPSNLANAPEWQKELFASVLPNARSLRVYMGGNMSWCSKEVCNIITSQPPNQLEQKLLWVERKNGILVVNAKIFTAQGKIAVELDGNRPYVNQNVIGFPKRTSTSQLVVVDEFDKPILNIKYLNKNSIQVEGTFFAPNYPILPSVVINQQWMLINGNTLSGSCLGEAGHSAINLVWNTQ